MRGRTRGIVTGAALASVVVLTVTGCIPNAHGTGVSGAAPVASALPSATPGATTAEGLSYSIDLPAGWHDLTDTYVDSAASSVLAGFWTVADDLSTDGAYATMSMFPLDPEASLWNLSEDAVTRWEEELDQPESGDSGYAETAEGGVITWASVTGGLNGERRTEHVAHVLYGPYYMYVEVDTPPDDEEDAHAILDALKTVTIAGPEEVGNRAGAPIPYDGTWYSYCGSIKADVQDGWRYAFQTSMDSFAWHCPEESDYLGSWFVDAGDSTYAVTVRRELDMSLDERLDELGTPEKVGAVATSDDGYTTELLASKTFTAPNGTQGKVIDVATSAPGSDTAYVTRMYVFEDDQAGVAEIFVYDRDENVVPKTGWLEPFIDSISISVAG
jgi:hypothetical protein